MSIFEFGIPFFYRSNFRAIVAGGGTDGGVPFMGEQLNHTKSETVYFDFSKTSMSIAHLKFKMRGQLKIVSVLDWIESIPRLGIGKFDFIGSTGVLHHLKCPQKGLNIVNDIQLSHGGAQFMVYGTYGRTGVYQIQELMQIINKQQTPMKTELRHAKAILSKLSDGHWLNHFGRVDKIPNHDIYDLFLHKKDVSYTIPGVYEWVQKSGYNVVDFSNPENRISMSITHILSDKILYQKLTKIADSVKHYSIGELICGLIMKQDLYVTKSYRDSEAIVDLKESVVYAYGSPSGFPRVMNDTRNYRKHRNETFIFSKLARTHIDNELLKSQEAYGSLNEPPTESMGFSWPYTKFNNFVVESLTKKPSRAKSLKSLIYDFNDNSKFNLTMTEGITKFRILFSYLKQTSIFFVKHQSIPSFPLTCCRNKFTLFSSDI